MIKAVLIFMCCSIATYAPQPEVAESDIAIIVNASNPVNTMGPEYVKNFWLRRFVRRWKENNKGILPVDRRLRCAEQEIFYTHVLGMPIKSVESYLAARQYQNGDNPPEKFNSDAEIINYVGTEAGAIGYVSASSINENDKNIKIVLRISK